MPSSIPQKRGKAPEQQATSKRTATASNEARPRSTPIDAQHQTIPQPPTEITPTSMTQVNPSSVQQPAHNETYTQNDQHTTPPRDKRRSASTSHSSPDSGPSLEYIERIERLAALQERLAMFPQRQGHQYGRVTLKGKAKALQGDVYEKDNVVAQILAASNRYTEGVAEDSAQFFNGNTDPAGARAFFESGVVPQQSDEEDIKEEEDEHEDHEMAGTSEYKSFHSGYGNALQD